MSEDAILKALDKQDITQEQDKAIRRNKFKFVKLIKACFKFCPKCKQEVMAKGNYWERLCPKCKKIYEKL